MAKNIGSLFERQLAQSFRDAYPGSWVHKNPTMHTAGGYANEQAPDLIIQGHPWSMLVEAKAVKGTSMPFNRVSDGQLQHLRAFDDTTPHSHGVIAILSYNGELGQSRRYEGWLIPITEWDSLSKSVGRKSLDLSPRAKSGLYHYLAPYQIHWIPGKVFSITSAVDAITSGPSA